ncbi:hypothetical protein [Glycomyces amatae]|nr:hypothetical protein [Glycomyces amatae]
MVMMLIERKTFGVSERLSELGAPSGDEQLSAGDSGDKDTT